jgi:sulfoxide reductase heme-binding subunit YedZ
VNASTQQTLASHGWWLASRASGVVALVLVTISVVIGLTMAGKLARRPGLGRVLAAVHEHTALVGLVAIGIHGVTLLGDPWLNPGIGGIAVPFKMAYRPLFTGLGVVAGYAAALLGLSFYARRRIGARLWRKAHRATVLVYVLGILHALGAGSDASAPWLRWWIIGSAAVVGTLFAIRLTAPARQRRRGRDRSEREPARRRTPRAAPQRRFGEAPHLPVPLGEEA